MNQIQQIHFKSFIGSSKKGDLSQLNKFLRRVNKDLSLFDVISVDFHDDSNQYNVLFKSYRVLTEEENIEFSYI